MSIATFHVFSRYIASTIVCFELRTVTSRKTTQNIFVIFIYPIRQVLYYVGNDALVANACLLGILKEF